MGRCNNRRVQQAAAERNSVPSRARFSKGPPKKNKGRGGGRGGRGGRGGGGRGGGSAADATKKKVISKITQRVEAKSRDAGGISGVISGTGVSKSGAGTSTTRIISKRPKRHPLEGVDTSKFDEIRLSEDSLRIVTRLLTTLGVVEDRTGSNNASRRNSTADAEGSANTNSNSNVDSVQPSSSTLRPTAANFAPSVGGKGALSGDTITNDFVPTFNHMNLEDDGGNDDDQDAIDGGEKGYDEDDGIDDNLDMNNVYALSGSGGTSRTRQTTVVAAATSTDRRRTGYEEYEEDDGGNVAGHHDYIDDSAAWAEEQLRKEAKEASASDMIEENQNMDVRNHDEEDGDDSEGSTNNEDSNDDAIRKTALYLHLTTELSFTEDHALQAVRVLEGWKAAGIEGVSMGADDDEKKSENDDTKASGSDELDSDQLGLALDWLCLHLDDDELKAGFKPNPRAKDKLPKRLKRNGALLPGTGATRPIAHESISIVPPLRGAEFRETTDRATRKVGFIRLGFHQAEAEKACEMTGPTPPSIIAEEDTDDLRVLLTLLEADIAGSGVSPLSGEKPNAADLEFAAMEREQELEALEAIYAENFEIIGPQKGEAGRKNDPECRLQLKIDTIEAEKAPSKLEGSKLHVFCRSTYPILAPPLLLFTNPTLAPSLLRKINTALIEKAKEMIGEPIVFALMEYLSEEVPVLYDDFVREQRAKEMAAEQLRLRKAAGHDIDKVIEAQYESGGQLGRRQRAKLRAAEKAYDRDEQLTKEAIEREKKRAERLERIAVEDKHQRYTRAEQAILQREKDRIAEEAEKAYRAAMNAAFLRGESVEGAREAARRAKIESLRANGEDVSDADEKMSEDEKKKDAGDNQDDPAAEAIGGEGEGDSDKGVKGKTPTCDGGDNMEIELPDDEDDDNDDGYDGGGATQTTLAFTDRLREFYEQEKAKKEAMKNGGDADEGGKDDLDKYHLTSAAARNNEEDEVGEDESNGLDLHVPAPVVIPSNAVRDVVQSVVNEQKRQPWLVCPEARAPTLEENGIMMHNKSDLTAEEQKEQQKISRNLRTDLQRKYQSAEQWEEASEGTSNGPQKKQTGRGKGRKRDQSGPIGQQFHKMMSQRSRLPAFKMKDDIVKTIASNQITVISGDTGCGKTTQVPQLVLDDMILNGRGAEANIIITQPRRISAIGVAERIAAERCERIGETSGYSIRLENKRSNKTRLLLCTTGILLRRLQVDPDLATVSHVFVDEVHDFLLIILKDLLQRRKSLKLVLMSATLNADTFSKYFDGCPTASIPGRAHPVKEYRLEDILQVTGYEVPQDSDYVLKKGENSSLRSKSALKKILPGYKANVYSSLSIVDEQVINYELIAKLLEHITLNHEDGAILVFLPGMMEITKCIDELYKMSFFQDPSKTVIYPQHSSLSTAEQTAVFNVPPEGVRKIVVATNIAETSITIEDVVYVVDSARVKENRQDEVNQMPTLVECWTSKASAKQRRGRAGRVRPGIAYHLYSTPTHQNDMSEYQLPEMLRVGLEDLVLQVMLLDLGEPSIFLTKAVDPPSALAIRNSLKLLEGLGAVECEWDDEDVRFSRPNVSPLKSSSVDRDSSCNDLNVNSGLTALGFHLATLPVDPRVGKMMIYGALFNCVDPALTIAAAMSARNPFMSPFDKREEADARRKEFSTEGSDHLTTLKAFNDWRDLRKKKGDRSSQAFLRDNFLSRLTLFQMEDLRRQFTDLLIDIGFLPKKFRCDNRRGGRSEGQRGGLEDEAAGPNKNSQNLQLVKAILCAGLYPNIIVAPRPLVIGTSDKKAGECAFSSQKGEVHLHPCTIVHQESKLESRYACYHEMVKTSKIYVRDFTSVSPFSLLLFGGNLKVYHQYGVVAVDEWLKFRISAKPATLVKHLRAQMETMLLRKIIAPEDDITESSEGKALIEAVSVLLAKEVGSGTSNVIGEPDRSAAEIVRPYTGGPDQGRNRGRGGRGRGRGGRGRGRGGRGRGRR